MAKRLALVDIRDVHFHERNVDASQRVAQRDTGVRQAARVDDDEIDTLGTRRMDAVDQRPFMIALEKSQRCARGFGLGFGSAFDVGQCDRPIHRRLARSQQIQVGTIEQQELLRHIEESVCSKVWHFAANIAYLASDILLSQLPSGALGLATAALQGSQVALELIELQRTQISMGNLAVGADQYGVRQTAIFIAKLAR